MLRPMGASTCRPLHTTWDRGPSLSQLIDITTSTHPSTLTPCSAYILSSDNTALSVSLTCFHHIVCLQAARFHRVPTRLALTLLISRAMTTILSHTLEETPRSHTPQPHLTLNTTLRGTPAAVPNKHIPYCSPGPQPIQLLSPPESPPNDHWPAKSSSLLSPASSIRLCSTPPVYSTSAAQLAAALDHIAAQPLPDPKLVFPWLHGLHPDNQIQLAFFAARKKIHRKLPTCLRGLTIVKAGGNLSTSKLKAAIAPDELISVQTGVEKNPCFHDCDPRAGFSVRNFHIQACKMATISDIVVYADENTSRELLIDTAKDLAQAQKAWRERDDAYTRDAPDFHTYVVLDPFSTFEKSHLNLVAADSMGRMTGRVLDFPHQERIEMRALSQASEIAPNVWLGPTPEPDEPIANAPLTPDGLPYDILIEANDFARMPDAHTLFRVGCQIEQSDVGATPSQLEFPSSGSIAQQTCRSIEVDRLVSVCKWIHAMANGTRTKRASQDRPGSRSKGSKPAPVTDPRKRRILIHCADGYTETSLLALAYLMFADGLPVHEAWIRMHRDKGRNFFAYPADKTFLQSIQTRLLQESPAAKKMLYSVESPAWMNHMDGSLPSRIMPYLYLGNLNHAQNPGLLKELGISRVLSVGEPISWTKDEVAAWGVDNFLFVDKVQDNGVDPLTEEFQSCLEFIGKCHKLARPALITN